MEFHSRSLKRAELALGFALFHLPGRSPWLKGIVERFFGTMSVQVLGHLDGKTFCNTKARGDYKSTKHARTTLTKLKADLLKWIVDDYHVRYHDGLKGVPLEQWYKRQPPDGMNHVPRFDMLTEFLGSADEKKISKRGVRLYGHYYYHRELSHLRAENGVDHVYEIRSNPYDIGAIQLLKPDGAWLTVPSDRPEQTVGFSIHQNTVHWDLAKALVPEGETVTEEHHSRAIEIAQAESEEILADPKGKKTVRKVARYGYDNGTFFTKVGSHTGGRVANDDEPEGDSETAEAAGASDASTPSKKANTAKTKRAKAVVVDADLHREPNELTRDEIEAERAARKARMRMAG